MLGMASAIRTVGSLVTLLIFQLLCDVGVALASDVPLVTCGSLVKLQHEKTKGLLHSHEISYGSGSGQQSVTANFEANDANSLWIVRALQGESCTQGTPLKNGGKLRLQHAATRSWLHSHHFQSPLTANQEVSAFGSDDNSDEGDTWAVSWEKGAATAEWHRDQKVHLRHLQTGVFLASHDRKYGRPIAGQQEVCGKGKSDVWLATEGLYFPPQTEN